MINFARLPATWPVLLALCSCLAMALSACKMEQEDAPHISWTSRRKHIDVGACTHCHTRLDLAGSPIPAISSGSRMPHAGRGVCSNCHQIKSGKKFNSLELAKVRVLESGVHTQGSVPLQSEFTQAVTVSPGQPPSAF